MVFVGKTLSYTTMHEYQRCRDPENAAYFPVFWLWEYLPASTFSSRVSFGPGNELVMNDLSAPVWFRIQKRSGLLAFILFSSPLILADELLSFVQHAPEVEAALQRLDAARLRVDAAGRWADAELEGMYSTKDTPEEDWPMWEVNLTQPLPKYGERSADRASAQAAVKMAEAELSLMVGTVAADSAMALAELNAALLRVDLLQQQLKQTEQTLASLDVRIGSGQGRISESLVLQSRLTSLRLAIEKDLYMAGEAEREARQMLGLDPETTLPAFVAPSIESIVFEKTPERMALEARRDEARAMKDMARAGGRPMTAVGLRFEREEMSSGDEDTIGVALMTELPWNSRRSARAEASAALAELEGRDAEIDALKRRFEADITRAERLVRLADQTRETTRENQERLDREYDAWIASTGTTGMMESSSVLMLIELLERSNDLQMQSIDAEAEAQTALAFLWRYHPFVAGDEHE